MEPAKRGKRHAAEDIIGKFTDAHGYGFDLEEAWLRLLDEESLTGAGLTDPLSTLLEVVKAKQAGPLLARTYLTLVDRRADTDALAVLRLLTGSVGDGAKRMLARTKQEQELDDVLRSLKREELVALIEDGLGKQKRRTWRRMLARTQPDDEELRKLGRTKPLALIQKYHTKPLALIQKYQSHEGNLRTHSDDEFIDLYRRVYAGRANFDEILDRAERQRAATGAGAGKMQLLEILDGLLKYEIGSHVEDARGWGFGIVRDVDLRRMEVTIDFEERPGHVIPILSAVEFVELVEEADRPRAVKQVTWEMLPIGEHPFPALRSYFKLLESDGHLDGPFDASRLVVIERLEPVSCYVGLGELSGYIAFTFEATDAVVLENPTIGNAIYVIYGEWRSLSSLTKRELLIAHGHRVDRIIHQGDWANRLEQAVSPRRSSR